MAREQTYHLLYEKSSASSEDHEDLEGSLPGSPIQYSRSSSPWSKFVNFWKHYGFGITFCLLNLGWTVMLFTVELRSQHTSDVPSPANDAVSYARVIMNNSLFDDNVYMGAPDDAQTEAWAYFNSIATVAVGSEDLEAIGKTSVQLVDGPDRYLVMLDVFHQLHCLDRIRQYIHRDYYELHETPTMQLIHVGHCLDSLRQIIMCHGDTELVTFHYVSEKDYPNPWPNPDFLVERKCRNWDSIVSWAEAHKASRDDSESRAVWEAKHGPAPPPG